MVDLDRRSFFAGSAAGVAWATTPAVAVASLSEALSGTMGLSPSLAALVAARLEWDTRRPRLVLGPSGKGRLKSIFGLIPADVSFRADALPGRACIALYDARTPARTAYHAVPGAEATACGVRMAAFHAGGRYACVLTGPGSGRVETFCLTAL